MKRWVRCFWDEEAVWFYFELDADGFVVRQVELQEPGSRALTAASLAEWQVAERDGWSADYENVYGLTAEPPISEWEGHDPQQLSADEFEIVWSTARRDLQDRPRRPLPERVHCCGQDRAGPSRSPGLGGVRGPIDQHCTAISQTTEAGPETADRGEVAPGSARTSGACAALEAWDDR